MKDLDLHLVKVKERERRRKDFIKRLIKNKNALIGLIIILIFIFCALFAGFIAPHHFNEQNIDNNLLKPFSEGYFLGTDEFGRCLFSRIIYGTRITFFVGFAATVISAFIGTTVGLVAGYFGGKIDQLLTVIINITWSFPLILLALILIVILGSGIYGIILSVSLIAWAGFARIVRGEVLSVKEKDFILAARALRISNFKILLRHILPNVFPPVLVMFSLNIGTTIIIESGLSFLGLGVRPPSASWGTIISMGRTYIRNAPWLTTFPGFAIMLVVLGFNLLGDGLRDIFDPKLRNI